MIKLNINQVEYQLEVAPDMPLLWVLRDILKLTGTKFSCGVGVCGACTVHLNGRPTRSCIIPVSSVVGAKITTIEGLENHPVQQAWEEEQVPQCGYCQSGQIMTAVALLENNPNPSEEAIENAMNVLCRCGSYNRIKKAVQKAATQEN